MLKAFVFAVLAALLATPVAAAEIYTGTIAGAPVVVVLTRNGAEFRGTYAYRSRARDLALSGQEAGGSVNLVEHGDSGPDDAEPPVTGYWRLIGQADGWTGTWRATPRGTARPIVLRLIATTRPDPEEAPEGWQPRNVSALGEDGGWAMADRPYRMEIARAPERQGPNQRMGAATFHMVIDPRSGAAWPQFTQYPGADADTLLRLNLVFEENRAIAIGETMECAASLYSLDGIRGGPDAPQVRITFISSRLIALNLSGSMNCGGAHPTNFQSTTTYDVRAARPINMETLLRLDTDAERAAFTRFWRQRMLARLRSHPGFAPEGCPFTEEDSYGVSYHPTAAGLAVEYVSNASVDAACAVDLVDLPLADLAPFLRPGAADYWQ